MIRPMLPTKVSSVQNKIALAGAAPTISTNMLHILRIKLTLLTFFSSFLELTLFFYQFDSKKLIASTCDILFFTVFR